MFSISRVSLLLCLLIITVSCQKGTESDSANQSTESTAKSNQEEDNKNEKPKPPKPRKTVEGNWVLFLPERNQIIPAYLLKITPSETKETETDDANKEPVAQAVEILGKGKDIFSAKIISSSASDQTVEFEESLLNEGKEIARLNFQGKLKLDLGAIFGNVSFNNENCEPVLLLATEETTFANIKGSIPVPSQELAMAIQSQKPFEALNEFTQKIPLAPLTIKAYRTLVAYAISHKKGKETIEELIKRYLETSELWGKRQRVNSLITVSTMLAISDSYASLATKYLDQADESIKDGVKPINDWKSEMALARARAGLKSKDSEQIKLAGNLLQKEFEKTPYDRDILRELANYEKSHGSIDKAIDHFGILAGSPPSMRERQLMAASLQNPVAIKFENPRDTLTALWKEKNGSTNGLDDYLTKSFKRFLQSFVSKEAKDVDLKKGNRVSLIELFTGAACPPCLAADLATGAIEESFPPSKVVVLRYHQHIPAPDPLTNTDSEARFSLYNHFNLPSINLNGQTISQTSGGGVEQVNSSYQTLLEALIPELSKNTDVKINLSADVKDANLKLKANVTGTEKIEENLRLVAVIAEDELEFNAPNGVKIHDMIVRSMLGEPNGIPAVDGKLTLNKSLPLDDFKSRLTNYLSAFEEKIGANFTNAPLALDKLHFVVFVQGELSRDIFQVASVPVSGKIVYKSAMPKPEAEKPINAPKPVLKTEISKEKPAKTKAEPETKPEVKKEKKTP